MPHLAGDKIERLLADLAIMRLASNLPGVEIGAGELISMIISSI